MIAKIYKEFLIILGIFIIGWFGFSYLKLQPKDLELTLSVEKEMELGDVFAESIIESETVINNDTIGKAIHLIKERLLSEIDSTEFDYKFYILKNDNINAFATLGGHIFIFSGLLEFASSGEEVAAVLAHEIGHIEKRHVASKLIKEIGIEILFSILSGGDPLLIGEVSKQAISSKFDRSQEAEADQFGLNLLEQSKISPYHMGTFFRKLKNEFDDYGENLEFLNSHPNLNKRIKSSLEYKIDSTFKPVILDIDWSAVKRNLETTPS